MPRLKPVLQYPGSKARIAGEIVSRFPKHRVYCEPFFGSGAILFAKPRSRSEIVNDLDHRVVNLFRVLREQPAELAALVALTPYARAEMEECIAHEGVDGVEAARAFLVTCWQAHGKGCRDRWPGWVRDVTGKVGVGRCHVWAKLPERILAAAGRLAGVQIECRPALDLIGECRNDAVLIYADPPYVTDTRKSLMYRHEMSDTDHEALLDALCGHPGPVVLSGYDCPMYRDRLRGWNLNQIRAVAMTGEVRTELLWRNRIAAAQEVLPW